MSTVFTDFLNNVDLAVNGFINEGYGRVRSACLNPLRLSLSLFVAVYGVLMLAGRTELSFRQALGRLGVMLFVYVLATNADVYTNWLLQLFVQGPAAIGNVVVGGGGGTGQNAAMDNFFNTGMDAGDKLWNRGNLYTLSPLFAAIVVYTITVGVAAYAAFLLALAKIALAVLLVLTPLFALCYLFKNTRNLFEGWLGQVIHYALVPVLVYSVLALILSIAQTEIQQIDLNADTATFPQVLELALAGIVAILLLVQVHSVASAIAGGVTLHTRGAFREGMRRGAALGMSGGRLSWKVARALFRPPGGPVSSRRDGTR